MTVSSSIKYACFRSSTIASRFSVIASPRMPSLPRLVSILYALLVCLMRFTRRMYPRNPQLNVNRETYRSSRPLPFLQLRLRAGLHRRLHALLGVGPCGCRNPGREGTFDERRVDQRDPVPDLRGQQLEHGLRREDSAPEVHKHEHLVCLQVTYGGFDPLGVSAERAVGVATDRGDLDLPRHLQDQVRRTFGDLLAVRDEHYSHHQEEPSRARAAASRSM